MRYTARGIASLRTPLDDCWSGKALCSGKGRCAILGSGLVRSYSSALDFLHGVYGVLFNAGNIQYSRWKG